MGLDLVLGLSMVRRCSLKRSFKRRFCPGGWALRCIILYTLFFIRTSNFGAGAERSYFFWQFEPEMFL